MREKLGRNEASFSLSHKLPVWENMQASLRIGEHAQTDSPNTIEDCITFWAAGGCAGVESSKAANTSPEEGLVGGTAASLDPWERWLLEEGCLSRCCGCGESEGCGWVGVVVWGRGGG